MTNIHASIVVAGEVVAAGDLELVGEFGTRTWTAQLEVWSGSAASVLPGQVVAVQVEAEIYPALVASAGLSRVHLVHADLRQGP